MARRHPYSYIIEKAQLFHSEHNSRVNVPVPIEIVIEYKLHFAIAPEAGLLDATGCLMSYLGSDGCTIFVDQKIWDKEGPQYRVCLAHELGHHVLHWDHADEFRSVGSAAEWKKKYLSIPQAVYDRMEEEAGLFAGLVLLPTSELVPRFNRALKLLDVQPHECDVTSKKVVTQRLALEFDVTEDLVESRIEREDLWD